MILADKIIEERKKNGWTQEDLAQKLGVSRQSVSKWESAGAIPDLKRLPVWYNHHDIWIFPLVLIYHPFYYALRHSIKSTGFAVILSVTSRLSLRIFMCQEEVNSSCSIMFIFLPGEFLPALYSICVFRHHEISSLMHVLSVK